MAAKKYRLRPVPGAREQAKREAEGGPARRVGAVEACRERQAVARAYKKGTDPRTDLAIAKSDATNASLRQGTSEKAPPANTLTQLRKMF